MCSLEHLQQRTRTAAIRCLLPPPFATPATPEQPCFIRFVVSIPSLTKEQAPTIFFARISPTLSLLFRPSTPALYGTGETHLKSSTHDPGRSQRGILLHVSCVQCSCADGLFSAGTRREAPAVAIELTTELQSQLAGRSLSPT